MNKLSLGVVALFASLAFLVGCAEKQATETADSTPADATYVAASEPAGAVGVGDARTNVKDEEDVVLVGRIGGSVKPFVDGMAAFTIVDPKVPYCAPDEGCPTPWDYCCTQNEVKDNIAMIKIVDKDGQPVSKDAGPLLGVKELDMVVIQGKAKRDNEGNLSVLADQVFVKK
jgi:hypothetical protein